ncbi:hypothetical protein QAD02_006609 [Eretmocerus hayati]|uniref:Uncharacterized protein n=1 Tax=Eretmocerus hayati TaxID=131215 RepID=A0ACC2N3N9_9HYME|nr:hypothetical protein QAD02_006609 [Eretmocerus hayati]
MILNQTCTEKLQTFHGPSKKYNDSPQQAKDFQRKRKASPKRSAHISKRRRKLEYLNDAARIDDTKSQEKKSEISGMSDDYKTWYIQHFRNTIANGCSTMLASGFNTTMPMKMIIPPANMYGAVDEYNSLYYDGLMDLKECGLFVMKEYPHICGTPDRLARLLNVLEVKCPYTAKDSLIHENIVPYLGRDEDGDNDFIDEMLVKLNRFYEKHFKPAILKKYIYKNTEKFI